MSAGIYAVEAELGPLCLVVAESGDQAKDILSADKDLEAVGEPCLIGTPVDPTPRVIA